MDGLTEGRMVHYVLNQGPSKGEHRPAVVVKVWRVMDALGELVPPGNGCCNLQVFTDGDGSNGNDGLARVLWQTSVLYEGPDGAPGTWHWIEKA